MADIMAVANTSMYTVAGLMILGMVVVLFIMLKQMFAYNVETDVWEQVNGTYVLHRTKGGIFKDKNGVRYFKTKKFGENNKFVNYREPNNEIYANYSTNILKVAFLPRVVKKQIAFMNPFGETFIPVRRSFVSIKRGVDLSICSKEQCEFCKEGINVEDFLNDPSKYLDKIKTMDSICEKHFTSLVNARYECIDQSDLSWMWREIDEVKKEFGDFLTKYAPIIVVGGMLAFALLTIIITYKMQPDLAEAIAAENRAYLQEFKKQAYEEAKNVTIPNN